MKFSPAAFLKPKWKQYISEVNTQFYMCVSDLLEKDEVLRLDDFIHHHSYTRLKHSLDVAYVSYFITRIFGWDYKSTARAGLLHDLFFYDRQEENSSQVKNHLTEHPKIALENARKISPINKIEADIIVKHMWLVTITPPRYRESYVVTFVDKACALKEGVASLFIRKREPKALTSCNW